MLIDTRNRSYRSMEAQEAYRSIWICCRRCPRQGQGSHCQLEKCPWTRDREQPGTSCIRVLTVSYTSVLL